MLIKLIYLFFFAVSGHAATIEDISKRIGACMQAQDSPNIAVLDFQYINKTDAVSSRVIQERFVTALSMARRVRVVERGLIEKVLREQYSQASGVLGANERIQLGQMLNADYVLTGTIIDLEGRQVEINARAISVASSTVSCAEKAVVSKDWKADIVLPKIPDAVKLPESIKSRIELAELYLKNSAPEKTIEILSDLLTQQPASLDPILWKLYLTRAQAYSVAYDSAAALNDADKAITLNPQSHEGYALRGWMYNKLRNSNYAIAELGQAIKYAPGNKVLYALRGNSELAARRFEEARNDFKIALSTEPLYSTLEFLSAELVNPFWGSGDSTPIPAESWIIFDRINLQTLSEAKSDWDYYSDMRAKIALTYALEGDVNAALSYISESFPELPHKWPQTAMVFSVYFGSKQYADAVKLCVGPNAFGPNALGTIYLSDIYLMKGCSVAYRAMKNYDLAIKMVDHFFPPSGLKYLYLHEAGKAQDLITQEFISDSGNGEIHDQGYLALALISFENGRKSAAKMLFRLYLKRERFFDFNWTGKLSEEQSFWGDGVGAGEIKRVLWDYLTEKEQGHMALLEEMVAKEGPVSDGALEDFKKDFFK